MVKNIYFLDSEGKCVAVKYYCDDWSTYIAKLAFEKSIFTKTQKTNARTEGASYPFGFSLIFMAVRFICFWKVIAFVLLSSDLVLELYLLKFSLTVDNKFIFTGCFIFVVS
ncbi:Coatomer subunit zeta-1 [Datura stramonium]|uniref:Coatomer subunit zeta n=1 Tax=Datura stramonium TaxID=4076 RepID=A0ABS8UVK9_DATST|nr:Coatomer subunit zeta-1 [Datura stramonium]